jgi:hypothetical protein
MLASAIVLAFFLAPGVVLGLVATLDLCREKTVEEKTHRQSRRSDEIDRADRAAELARAVSAFGLTTEVQLVNRGLERRYCGKSGALSIEISAPMGDDSSGSSVRVVVSGAQVGQVQPTLDGAALWEWFPDGRARQTAVDAPGRPAELLQARRRFAALLREGAQVTLTPSRLEVVFSTSLEALAPNFKSVIDRCLEVARGLSMAPVDAAEALAGSVQADPDPEWRLRTLEVLLKHFPDTEAAREAAQTAMASDDPRVRLAGAVASPEFEWLTRFVAGQQGCNGELRASALRHAVRAFPLADHSGLLVVALQSGVEALQVAAAGLAAASPHAARFERLLEAAAPGSCEARSESRLVQMLGSYNEGTRLAAVRALEEVGSRNAVEPLRALFKGGSPNAGVRRAAREAVWRIQSRLGVGGAGGLSIVPAERLHGALSLPGTSAS